MWNKQEEQKQDHSGNGPVDTFADGLLDQISNVERLTRELKRSRPAVRNESALPVAEESRSCIKQPALLFGRMLFYCQQNYDPVMEIVYL
jgi:hypothetical protein